MHTGLFANTLSPSCVHEHGTPSRCSTKYKLKNDYQDKEVEGCQVQFGVQAKFMGTQLPAPSVSAIKHSNSGLHLLLELHICGCG